MTKTVRDTRPEEERRPILAGQQLVVFPAPDDPEAVSLVELAVDGLPAHPDRVLAGRVARARRAVQASCGHRGPTHSVLAALIAGALVGGLAAAWLGPPTGTRLGLTVCAGYAVHLLEDMASGPVPLWWPSGPRWTWRTVWRLLCARRTRRGPPPNPIAGAGAWGG